MSRQETHAWFNLGVLALAAALFALALPHIGAQRAIGYFGICGLWGLSPLFYRKGKKIMALDERERAIQQQAFAAGYSVFWVLFVVSIMLFWGHHQGRTVPADVLPLFLLGSFVVIELVRSITTLLLCKRGVLHG